MNELAASPLGKKNIYFDQYNPELLFAICRDGNRINIGIDINSLPFDGTDIWNGFDFTWLDENRSPHFGVLTIAIPADSPNLIESKSLKLYLFSFANSIFKGKNEITNIIEKDLSVVAGKTVNVLYEESCEQFSKVQAKFTGQSIDGLDVQCNDHDVNSSLLIIDKDIIVEEQLCSELLKSNCLVTGKPDWGSVRITYKGPKINQDGLLKYIISYRNHQGFHEQCIEHIFFDILTICKPSELSVEGRYTRRGGLDINPVRTNTNLKITNDRLFRQ